MTCDAVVTNAAGDSHTCRNRAKWECSGNQHKLCGRHTSFYVCSIDHSSVYVIRSESDEDSSGEEGNQ